MYINNLNQPNITNFKSNLKFIPVKNMQEAKKVAELYTSMKVYRNKPLCKFIENITKDFDTYKASRIFHNTVNNDSGDHIEIVENDNELIGAFCLNYKRNNPVAKVEFMVETPKIRQKKISRDFILAIAEKIYNIAISNNIKAIRWSTNLKNPEASNLYKKRIKNADTQIDLQKGCLVYTIDTENLKNNIDEYKKHIDLSVM